MGARAELGKARRKQIGRQKKFGVAKGIFDTTAVVSSFVGGQAKKAKTAWGEYEAGYKELGGEGFERPKFGQKGYFKGPEGDVRIGGQIYDRGQIQKAGSFLGSDAASILDPEQRQQYLGRTAPGRRAPGSIEGFDYGSLKGSGLSPEQYDIKVSRAEEYEAIYKAREKKKQAMGAGTYRGPGGQMVDPNPFADLEQTYGDPLYGPKEDNLPSSIGYGQSEYQTNQLEQQRELEQQWEKNRIRPWDRQREERMQEGVKQNPYMPGTPWLPGQDEEFSGSGGMLSYARGGDFITNGPQKILVGDNPSGRERVTIRPLDSEDYNPKGYYGKKRNWLEALYENNRLRKND